MSRSTSDNHKQAPVSAALVADLRETFGDVKVVYVKEESVELGERQPSLEEYFQDEMRKFRAANSY